VSSNSATNLERRAFQRFGIECDVRYRVMGIEVFGNGKTVNVSRCGALLAIDRLLSAGLAVEVEMDWPAKMADGGSLKLVLRGQIVRSEKNGVALAAMKISWYRFITEVHRP
jgi:hypothetical protein